MRFSVFSVLAAAVIVFSGCAENSSVNTPASSSTSDLDKLLIARQMTYQYVGHARDGSAIVRGQLLFTISNAGRVAGRWELRSAADPGRIGPQVGRGNLSGTYSNGSLSIDLNPGNADNNVLLMGRLTRTEYAGRWQWVGFPGVLNGGTFSANRVVSEAVAD